MKKLLVILFLVIPFGLSAQTDRELLLELVKQQTELAKQQAKQGEQIAELVKQMAENNKQMTELAKQQAIISTKVDGLEKRFDTQNNLIGGMIAFVAVLVGVLIWDRRAANAPLVSAIESKTSA